MDIYSLFTLLGGLAFFLFGMSVVSANLEKLIGGSLETLLRKMKSGPAAIAYGAGITVAIQSSSALMVMLVGLVNSGIMEFGKTIGVIMGSNIGTTFTSWILSMNSITGSGVLPRMLNPDGFAPITAFAGILLTMFSKDGRRRDVGSILVGFGVLMSGMTFMEQAFSPLSGNTDYSSIIQIFSNPLIGVLAGTVLAAAVQSSVASVGLLQCLSAAGGLTYGISIPVIMGMNIGTCITALVSSRGANRNARRVAAVHLYFNLIGTVVCLTVFYILNALFNFGFSGADTGMFGISLVHTLFNLITALILLPFSKHLARLAFITVKGEDEEKKNEEPFLDERLLNTPSVAIAECRTLTEKMADITYEAFMDSMQIVLGYDEKIAAEIIKKEDIADNYEDKLGTYLVKVSGCSLTDKDANSVSRLLHCIGDFERISDHALNLMQVSREMHEKKIKFSRAARTEIDIMAAAVTEILEMSIKAFKEDDAELARKVEPLEEVIDGLRMELKNRHVLRLKQEKCTMELGFIFSDLLTNLERVSDHCSNIAVCLIQLEKEKFDTHEYITNLKENDKLFQEMRIYYVEKYSLPD